MDLKKLRTAVLKRSADADTDSLEGLAALDLCGKPPLQSVSFGRTHTKSGQFTDTYTFGKLARRSTATASLLHVNLTPAQNIVFEGASLSGHPFDFFTSLSSMGGMLWTVPVHGELVLTVWGGAGVGEGAEACATYSGVINLAAEAAPPGEGHDRRAPAPAQSRRQAELKKRQGK